MDDLIPASRYRGQRMCWKRVSGALMRDNQILKLRRWKIPDANSGVRSEQGSNDTENLKARAEKMFIDPKTTESLTSLTVRQQARALV